MSGRALLIYVEDADLEDLGEFAADLEPLLAAGTTRLALDLRHLSFVSSTALGYLIRLRRVLEERGGELVLVRPSRFVTQALLILGLDELFRVFANGSAACAYLRHGTSDEPPIDLQSLHVSSAGELVGRRPLLYRVVDEEDEAAASRIDGVGRLVGLYDDGLDFRCKVPIEGLVPRSSSLTTTNFDTRVQAGARMHVKYRVPKGGARRIFEAEGTVASVEKKDLGSGVVEAWIRLSFDG